MNGSQDESPHLLALGELMGRPPKAFDQIAVRRLIRGRRVLVTGAGGSIGAELVRQIAGLSPGHLTLVDNSEFGLYAIDQYLRDHRPELSRQAVLCDIRDRYLVESWFAHEAPEVVFHAAALKHVPMSEDHPIEAVRTNILGTQNVADACAEHGHGAALGVERAARRRARLVVAGIALVLLGQELHGEPDAGHFIAGNVKFARLFGAA